MRGIVGAGSGFFAVFGCGGGFGLRPRAPVMPQRGYGAGFGGSVKGAYSGFFAFGGAVGWGCYCPFAPLVDVGGVVSVAVIVIAGCEREGDCGDYCHYDTLVSCFHFITHLCLLIE